MNGWCTPRIAQLLKTTEVLCYVACQHRFGAAEKGERKVSRPFGGGCYSCSLHTPVRTVEVKTRASARKVADPLDVYVLDTLGLNRYSLGPNVAAGEAFAFPVPHGVWVAAISREDKLGWTLVGCTASPGFEWSDCETANVQQLCAAYPAHADVINAFAL